MYKSIEFTFSSCSLEEFHGSGVIGSGRKLYIWLSERIQFLLFLVFYVVMIFCFLVRKNVFFAISTGYLHMLVYHLAKFGMFFLHGGFYD